MILISNFLLLLCCVFHLIKVIMCFCSLSPQIPIYSRGSVIRESSVNFQFEELWWPTQDGVDINMLRCKSKSTSLHQKQPPILFIHGSFHSAWCYQEHFMPYFSSCGYDCFAMSLRGTKASALSKDIKSVRIEEHVGDVSFVVEQICRDSSQRPIIVAHSFGGLVLMKILERPEMRDAISAAVFLCSIPPSGNGAMTKRFLVKSPLLSLKIIWGFVLRGVTTNADLCRELFFDSRLDAELLAQYMAHFKEDSSVVVDFAALSSALPSKTSMRADGSAAWLPPIDGESVLYLVLDTYALLPPDSQYYYFCSSCVYTYVSFYFCYTVVTIHHWYLHLDIRLKSYSIFACSDGNISINSKLRAH